MKRKGIVLTKQDHVLKGKEEVKENKSYQCHTTKHKNN
jgi:hypothetical protein